MKRKVLFVMGPSGVGKTTLVRALLGASTHPVGRWTVGIRCAAAGPYTGLTLDGGDQLPGCMSVVETMLDTLDDVLPRGLPVVLDGQRFGAWAIARLAGKVTRVAVLLEAPVRTLVSRRDARGSGRLSERTLKGQARSLERVSRMADARVVVDATLSKAAVLHAVEGHLR